MIKEKPVDVPPYINENGKKYFLSLSQDIQGYWNVGYSACEETYLAWSVCGENATIDEALGNLARLVKELT